LKTRASRFLRRVAGVSVAAALACAIFSADTFAAQQTMRIKTDSLSATAPGGNVKTGALSATAPGGNVKTGALSATAPGGTFKTQALSATAPASKPSSR
jgi:hypothetical protein